MRVLGLTGDIASGKTSVAELLRDQHGAAHIDADRLVHELYANRNFARQLSDALVDFDLSATDVILNESGGVDRAALGRLVFGDARALRRLEAIVHPAVASLREQKIQELSALDSVPAAVVLEAVKLIESGQARGCDAVWCVRAAPAVQLHRLMENRGLDENAARARLAHQPPFEVKKALLGALPLIEIWNNGSRETLRAVVEEAWRNFQIGTVEGT